MIVDDLNTIVEMGNDSTSYIRLRLAAENWENQVRDGDESAATLLKIIKQFARLCELAKENRL